MAKAKTAEGEPPKGRRRNAAKPAKGKPANHGAPHPPEDLPDDDLLELVQRQTFRFFWDGAHPVSGLARDRTKTTAARPDR